MLRKLFLFLFLLFLLVPSPALATHQGGSVFYCDGRDLYQRSTSGGADSLVKGCTSDQICGLEDSGALDCIDICPYTQEISSTQEQVCLGEMLPDIDAAGNPTTAVCRYTYRVAQSLNEAGDQLCGAVVTSTVPPPTGPKGLGPAPAGIAQLENLFGRFVSISVGLAFVAMFVILVVAGINFLKSGGEPKAIAAARDAIVWALLGILFLVIAWLVLLLISAFTGVDIITKFNLRTLCGNGGTQWCP